MVQKKIDVFHWQNLQHIMDVTWKDRVTNTDVLTRTDQRHLQDIVAHRIGNTEWCQNSRLTMLTANNIEISLRRHSTVRFVRTYSVQAKAVTRTATKEIATRCVYKGDYLLPIIPHGTGGTNCVVLLVQSAQVNSHTKINFPKANHVGTHICSMRICYNADRLHNR